MLIEHLGGVCRQEANPIKHYYNHTLGGLFNSVCGQFKKDGARKVETVWPYRR
jgi:hypothetical protein